MSPEDIESRFGFHKATIEGKDAELRAEFKRFATYLNRMTPESRTKALMFTELETASMWAHKAIAETASLLVEE